MKMRELFIVLATALVCLAYQSQRAWVSAQQPIGPVDGRETPELIPDRFAYSLFFRLLSRQDGQSDRERLRAYLSPTSRFTILF